MSHCIMHLDLNVWVCVSNIFQQCIILFAYEWLAMMAGDIVPVHAIIVEIVEHGQTIFVSTALLEFPIVWLRLIDASVGGPIVLQTICGRSQFLEFSSPEPSVDGYWLKIGTIATLEVAQTTAGPDVFYLKKKE